VLPRFRDEGMAWKPNREVCARGGAVLHGDLVESALAWA
jgi:hypothetical protein